MLQFLRIIRKLNSVRGRPYSTAVFSKEKWDLYSSVSLERKPIITRDMNELELKFQKLLLDIEFERSHKSNFELRVEADQKRAKEVKEGNINISDMDSFPQQTGQDFLDASIEELKSFKFAPRKNDDSVEGNVQSLERALDRYLLLLINEKIGQKNKWVLPQGKHVSGETLRETAERILREKCGSNVNAQFMGNAPFGFYKYRYPQTVRSGESVGAKIFFFKALMNGGEVKVNKEKCEDFMWATRSELSVLPRDYFKSVRMFLIDEEH